MLRKENEGLLPEQLKNPTKPPSWLPQAPFHDGRIREVVGPAVEVPALEGALEADRV